MTTSKRSTPIGWCVAALLLSAALAPACYNDPELANSNFSMKIFANPTTLNLLPGDEGQSAILVVVYNNAGYPQRDIGIRFEATAGALESQNKVITTDANGEAHDILYTTDTSTVTAASGSVTASTTVTVVAAAAQAR